MTGKNPSKAALAARRRRVEAGDQAEQQARLRRRPTHNQLMLPLLGAIAAAGGRARPGDVYAKLAEQLAVPEDVRQQSTTFGHGRTPTPWARHVRFAMQTANLPGYLARTAHGRR